MSRVKECTIFLFDCADDVSEEFNSFSYRSCIVTVMHLRLMKERNPKTLKYQFHCFYCQLNKINRNHFVGFHFFLKRKLIRNHEKLSKV